MNVHDFIDEPVIDWKQPVEHQHGKTMNNGPSLNFQPLCVCGAIAGQGGDLFAQKMRGDAPLPRERLTGLLAGQHQAKMGGIGQREPHIFSADRREGVL